MQFAGPRGGGARQGERDVTDAGAAASLCDRLCSIGRRLHEAGLIAGTAGNLSARLGEDRLLVTPRGVRKDGIEPADLVEVSFPEPTGAERSRASTELPAHLACYRAAPRAGSVLHAHAPALTAAGLRGLEIGAILPEVEQATGRIVAVPFAPSGSEALGEGVHGAVSEGATVVLLARHGVLVVGPDPETAFDRLELAELSAAACLMGAAAGLEMDLRPIVRRYLRRSGGA